MITSWPRRPHHLVFQPSTTTGGTRSRLSRQLRCRVPRHRLCPRLPKPKHRRRRNPPACQLVNQWGLRGVERRAFQASSPAKHLDRVHRRQHQPARPVSQAPVQLLAPPSTRGRRRFARRARRFACSARSQHRRRQVRQGQQRASAGGRASGNARGAAAMQLPCQVCRPQPRRLVLLPPPPPLARS